MPKKQRIYDYFSEFASEALHIVIFEIFVKSMTSCLLKLKVTPSFCFAFKIPDDVTAPNGYVLYFYIYYLRLLDFLLFFAQKTFSGWRVEAGPTPKYVLMIKPQPNPTQAKFGPWGLNSTRLNPFFHPKNGFNPKNRVGFGRTTLEA